MIWRLLVSVLAITDTGGIAVTSENSNWPSEDQCQWVLRSFYQNPPSQEIGGHRVTMKVSGSCVPVDFGPAGAALANGGYIRVPPELNQGRYGGPPFTR
jgi:hypothetical protein